MSTVKIEHVNPNTSHPIAFDVMAPKSDNPAPEGAVLDKDGNEIRETMIIAPGHFRIMDLSGGLMLHEVSQAELTERERKIGEQAELEAEVARERKAKADQEHAEKVKAEREEHKKKIEAEAAKQDEPVEPTPWTDDELAGKGADGNPMRVNTPVDDQPELVS